MFRTQKILFRRKFLDNQNKFMDWKTHISEFFNEKDTKA